MPADVATPWLSLREAAKYARRGERFIRREVKAGRLRAARVGGRGEIVIRLECVDAWLESLAEPIEIRTFPSRVAR